LFDQRSRKIGCPPLIDPEGNVTRPVFHRPGGDTFGYPDREKDGTVSRQRIQNLRATSQPAEIMPVQTVFVSILLLPVLLCSLSGSAAAESSRLDKVIIGRTCRVQVEELGLDYLARVDTGASITSIHATDFLIEKGTSDPLDNVGRKINFLTVSSDGQYKRMTSEIAEIQTVVSAQGREKRYLVRLTLSAMGVRKTILVNLRDRSQLRYKLLLGRNWLADDFLVDVDLDEEIPGEEERLK